MKKYAGPFAVLLGIGLAVSIPLSLEVAADGSSSNREIISAVVLAIVIALGASGFLIFLFATSIVVAPRIIKGAMTWITLKAVAKAIAAQAVFVETNGITSLDGDVGFGLSVGEEDGIRPGHKFVVLNTADQERWGVLEARLVSDTYCHCSVFDKINPEFWADLERRMRYDASPPRGITIRREIPEEQLLDWLRALLKTWRS